jgi:hypothetical protein
VEGGQQRALLRIVLLHLCLLHVTRVAGQVASNGVAGGLGLGLRLEVPKQPADGRQPSQVKSHDNRKLRSQATGALALLRGQQGGPT